MKRGLFSVALVVSAIIVVSLIGCGGGGVTQAARRASATDLKSGVWDVHSTVRNEQNVTLGEFFGQAGAATGSIEFFSVGQWDTHGTFTVTLLDATGAPVGSQNDFTGTWNHQPGGILTLTGANMDGTWGAVVMHDGGLLVLRTTADDGTTRQIAFSPR